MKDVKVQELFTLDQESLDMLPHVLYDTKIFPLKLLTSVQETRVWPHISFSVLTVSRR